MNEVSIIGVDLAKHVFQLHGAAADGTMVFRKKLSRSQFRQFMSDRSCCVVAMEACATSHYWAREFTKMGHEVRLIAPIYVKPFVKRQKTDAADAEAIVEAAQRPNMRFVLPKSAQTQAHALLFRTREQLVRQRTETINALRGHLAEFGLIAPQGIGNLPRLPEIINDPSNDLPELARDLANLHLNRIDALTILIEQMMQKIRQVSRESGTARTLQTMPGVGPICAMAVEAFAPAMDTFKSGRDFSAWLGLIPRQYSSGGKERLGRTSKMGQRDIRQLLIIGAMSVIASMHRYKRKADGWLQDKLNRKPRIIAAIALANKMARRIWAMVTKGEAYSLTPAI
ncbi:MAG TPA: IS110 family transposase [Ochrobactrum sp.]|nr:IS110 family transposase [Ochrobactrum sp.]